MGGSISEVNIGSGKTVSSEWLKSKNLDYYLTDTLFPPGQTDKKERLSFNLSFGLGGRVPISDSYYALWKDLAIGDVQYKASDGLPNYFAGNWPDYFFYFIRADLDFLVSRNLSIGLFAYPDKYKKTLTLEDKTNNWIGDGSNGLEDHWKLRRKLRIATYNFGPDIKFKVPFNNWELSISYMYGWSYLLRSSFEFSYFNQETGTGDKGYLGLLYVLDGNITKLRYSGSSNFQRVELGITKIKSEDLSSSVTLKVGYQFYKMDNIRYKVLKFDNDVYYEAIAYFYVDELREYQVGEIDNIYINENRFNLDLGSFYLSLVFDLKIK
jgi:hypothetical protein